MRRITKTPESLLFAIRPNFQNLGWKPISGHEIT
jgi:hypothetical protein